MSHRSSPAKLKYAAASGTILMLNDFLDQLDDETAKKLKYVLMAGTGLMLFVLVTIYMVNVLAPARDRPGERRARR